MPVYFAERGGAIKIGFSATPAERARQLRANLLATTDGGYGDEAQMHRRFAADRLDGEWFRPSSDLSAVIANAAGHTPRGEIDSPLFRMANRIMGGSFTETVLAMHRAGMVPERISKELYVGHGVEITGRTLARWIPVLLPGGDE